MYRKILTRGMVPALALLFTLAPNAHAQLGPIWNHTASSCAIDEADLGIFQANQEEVFFMPGAVGDIFLRCNVNNPLDVAMAGQPGWDLLGITYQDPDGMGVNTRVVAFLYQVNKATGVQGLLSTFDSNALADPTEHYSSICFAPPIGDFLNFYYYVQVRISRNAQGGNVKVCGVDLYYCD